MKETKWLNLQLFAEGEGGGEAAPSGENASVAAEQRLRELGVPEDKIRKRANKTAVKAPDTTAKAETVSDNTQQASEQGAAANTHAEETATEKPTRMSWDEIMADPEYNKQMQAVVQSRLRTAKTAEDNLAKLTPAVELLARRYNLDPANMDYDALTKAINDDDSYYEDKALEMGVSVETAKKIDRQERDTARENLQKQRTLEEQKLRNHYESLENQGKAMKKVFPNFDLQKELQDPRFFRMTSPSGGISVEDAYYAIHRNEIQTAAMQVTAQKTAQKISNAIQSGSRRPDELGTSSQAPSATTFDYRNADRNQREALKKRIRDAAARGEKLYPGQ